MFTGILKIDIIIQSSGSLKDKRRIIRSVIQRLRNRYNVSVSEVGGNDKWQSASLGISTVSNSKPLIDETMDAVIRFIENDGQIEITKYHKDIV